MNSNYFLPARRALELFRAAEFALFLNLPFNCHITIRWGLCSLTDQEAMQAALQRFLERLRKWLILHCAVAVFIWSTEHSRTNGVHTHIAMHLSETDGEVDQRTATALLAASFRWIPKFPERNRGNVIRLVTRWARHDPIVSHRNLVSYLIKMTDPNAEMVNVFSGELVNVRTHLGVSCTDGKFVNHLNPVTVHRAGVSTSISHKAQAAAHFTSEPLQKYRLVRKSG